MHQRVSSISQMVVFFSSVPKPNNHWRIWCQREYFCRNSISTFFAPKSRSSFVANIRYIVYDCSSSIGQRCAGNSFAISNIGHHSSLCNSATSCSISSLILPLDFVLVFYCSTMISRHNRVGTLFFATAEFIFDDWHRFLGVLIGLPCWSATAHCRLNTLSVVIQHLWVLSFTQRSLIPRIFYLRLKPLVATFHTCTCRHCLRRFLLWRYTSEYICNTNFLCRFWYTAPCCCDIRNSPSEVSMPFRAKGQDKFTEKSPVYLRFADA